MPTAKKLSPKTKVALKKVIAKENRRIARDNKAFEKMTPSEKRVQIARDVLAQLALKRLVPRSGTWLAGTNDTDLFSRRNESDDSELQQILLSKKQCEGCALGGMFMCAVERANKLKISDLSEDSRTVGSIEEEDVFSYMKKFFSKDQLEKIEAAFERGEGSSEDLQASEWLPDLEDPGERMRLIMENIIVNKGRFNLNHEPKMVWTTPGFKG